MRKKNKVVPPQKGTAGFGQMPNDVDFYAGGSTERPLAGGPAPGQTTGQVRKTERHVAISGRRKENVDLREKMALVTILKTIFMILLLVVAFAMLWKGIKIYEESVWLEDHADIEESPVMREVVMVDDFDLADPESREQFVERIEIWKEAERLVGSSEALLQRNNYDEAILRCQDALRLDPAHMGALDQLGVLYFSKGMHLEAANAYIRLLSVDPSSEDVQRRLIAALNAVGDYGAVRHMAEWYLKDSLFDVEVQRYLAHALFYQEDYPEAVTAYKRVLQDAPGDVKAMEQLVLSYLLDERYKEALSPLLRLRDLNYRNPVYYHQIAVTYAQLEKGYETVQILGRAAQIFGNKVVMAWMQDPRLDPVRDDRTFKAFADHVGGEGFRTWLEKMSENMDSPDGADSEDGPMLTLPEGKSTDMDLLREDR